MQAFSYEYHNLKASEPGLDAIMFPVVTDADARLPLFLTTVGHWDHQESMKRPDGFPDYQWLQVVTGEGVLEVDGQRLTVKAGQSFCLYPHIPHHYEPVKGPWGVYWVSFGGSMAAPLLEHAGAGKSGVYESGSPDTVVSQMRGMLEVAQGPSHPFIGTEYSKRLYALLLDLGSRREQPEWAERDRIRLQPVQQYIEDRLDRQMTIAELAAAAGVSSQHLCTLFRRTLGVRPMAYINRERIKRSKEMMFREPGMPVREIARCVGIDNPSYFGALFKRWEGHSPEQFKRMHGLRG